MAERSLFNDTQLSDVAIKFSDQEVAAHKCILSRKSDYFYKAFTGRFPVVASSHIVNLGDDDDPTAICAMIRHLYDLPYDQLIDAGASTDNTIEDLMFHIKVFTAADKYDVPCLRAKVAKKFRALMEASWEAPDFAEAMKAVCLPSAPDLADPALQEAAARFCTLKIGLLMKNESFKAVLEEEEPFAGRLLVGVMENKVGETIWQCKNCDWILREVEAKHGSCGYCGHASQYVLRGKGSKKSKGPLLIRIGTLLPDGIEM